MRNREMIGAKWRGSLRKAMPVKSAVVVNIFLCPARTALPKVGTKKYFCPISQLTSSRVAATQGCDAGGEDCPHGIGLSWDAPFIFTPFMLMVPRTGFTQSLRLGSSCLA